MFIRLNTILCFLLFLAHYPIIAQDNFKVFVPEYIPIGGSFEVSLITSKKSAEIKRFEFSLFASSSLSIRTVELWTNKGKIQIPLKSEFYKEYSVTAEKIEIDLSDTTLFENESFFQLVISLSSEQTESNNLRFFGKFFSNDGVIDELVNSEVNNSFEYPELFEITFDYYDKFTVGEYSASFEQNSYLNLPLEFKFDEILVVNFWMKMKNFNPNFLRILNLETNRVEYYLSVNKNQMLTFNSKENNVFQLKPFFISRNIWYNFTLVFDKRKSIIALYCNGEESAKAKVANYFAYDNLVIRFQNDKPNGNFSLEQLRLINDASLLAIIRNCNYSNYEDDRSSIALQLNFSETELISLQEQKLINYESIGFNRSTAPIFPRAPEINIKLLNNFYEVEWKGGDIKNAEKYIVEKAIGNSNFEKINNVDSDNDDKKVYSILAEKHNQADIYYFRIKQINKDGTEVYSDVVKVGQGLVEDVIIGQNFPNPFNPTTLIEFELLQDSDVEVKVYNLAGKEVAILHKGFLSSGMYQYQFDATGLPSGIYIYQVTTPISSQTRKMILTK